MINLSGRQRAALLAGFVVFAGSTLAMAQQATETQILEALTPKPKGVTRSLSLGAPAPAPIAAASEEGAFIESLKKRTTRSLSTGERQKLAEISADKPSIDLEIPFDFNSAQIGPKAMPAIKSLGAALANPQLRGGTFIIAGHTDAKGSDPANQTLSERRAEAVKRYLVENYKIAPENLLSVGYGESRLKNPANPVADENRRVQATNVTETKSAAAR